MTRDKIGASRGQAFSELGFEIVFVFVCIFSVELLLVRFQFSCVNFTIRMWSHGGIAVRPPFAFLNFLKRVRSLFPD